MVVQRADDLVGFDAVTVDLFLAVRAAAETQFVRPGESSPGLPVRYIREPGRGLDESGRKRSPVVVGLFRYPRATLGPAM